MICRSAWSSASRAGHAGEDAGKMGHAAFNAGEDALSIFEMSGDGIAPTGPPAERSASDRGASVQRQGATIEPCTASETPGANPPQTRDQASAISVNSIVVRREIVSAMTPRLASGTFGL